MHKSQRLKLLKLKLLLITPVTAEINNASADLKIVLVEPAAVTISVNEPDSNSSMSEPEALSLNDTENLGGLGGKSVISAMTD